MTVILYLRNSASELLTVEVVLTPPGLLFDGRSTAFRGGTSFIAMQSVRASDPALEDYLELLEYNEWGEPSPLPQDIVRMDAAAAVAAAAGAGGAGATLAGRGTSAACYNWDGERMPYGILLDSIFC